MSKNKKYKIYNKKKLEGCIDERNRKFEVPAQLKEKPITITTPDGQEFRSGTSLATFAGPFFENTNRLYKHVNNIYKKNYDDINWDKNTNSKTVIENKYKNKKIYIY